MRHKTIKLHHRMFACALILLLSPMAANATLITLSYDTGNGVLTFDLEGIIQADNDTIEVTSIVDPVQVDGNDVATLPFVGSETGWRIANTFTGVGPGIVSFSGTTMDILACTTDDCYVGLVINTTHFITSRLHFPGTPYQLYNAQNLSITSGVPEPGTLALLAAGFGGLYYRRRVVLSRSSMPD